MNQKRLTAYLLLILTSAIWGIAGPVIKNTLIFIPPFTFLFWRFLLTSIIFLPLFYWSVKKEKLTLMDILTIAPIGFLGIPLCLSLVFLGFDRTSALDGTIIATTAPIFIVLAGAFFLKEEVTKLEALGIGVAIAGSLVMVAQPFLEGNAFAQRNLLGNLLILCSNLAWTAYVIISKIKLKKYSALTIVTVSFFVGLVAIFPFALIEQLTIASSLPFYYFDPAGIWGLLYMIVFSSVVAYFAFESGVKLIEASEATLFAYLQPVFAAPVAIFWLKETITLPFLIGSGIIGLGVFLTLWYNQS